jgi:hypothetical protein
MFKFKGKWRFAPQRSVFGSLLLLALAAFAICPEPTYATVRNVLSYGAVGDGVHDDTGNINSAIAALVPGDTLLFPCTTSNTYLISSKLWINVADVTIDGSGCAKIRDTYSNTGTPTGEIMVIGGNGSSIDATYGSAVALSAVANELSTSFYYCFEPGGEPRRLRLPLPGWRRRFGYARCILSAHWDEWHLRSRWLSRGGA